MGYSATTENSTSTASSTTSSTKTALKKVLENLFAAASKENTPLEDLVRSALTRAGNFSPSRIDGEVMMMMIELANRVVEDVRKIRIGRVATLIITMIQLNVGLYQIW